MTALAMELVKALTHNLARCHLLVVELGVVQTTTLALAVRAAVVVLHQTTLLAAQETKADIHPLKDMTVLTVDKELAVQVEVRHLRLQVILAVQEQVAT
jgi:phenylalanine-4-hydroxylase